MTREEAIQWLTDIKNVTENWSQEVAIDMAIEALSADAVTQTEHDKEWIIGCIKHDGFIKTHRFDEANQIILDALEKQSVVRCKDCRHNETRTVLNHGVNEPSCTFTKKVLTENDYCSFGERAEK